MQFILRFKLFGAVHAVEVVPTVANLATALSVVRMEGQGHTHDLLVVHEGKSILTVEKENVFDNLKPHLRATKLFIGTQSFQSAASLNPTRDLAEWLLKVEVKAREHSTQDALHVG